MDSFLPAGRTTSALSLEKRSVVPLQGREREGGIIQTARAPLCRACRDGATTTTFRSSSGVFGRGYRLPCISVRTGPDERFLSSARRSLVTHCIWVRGTARQAIIAGGGFLGEVQHRCGDDSEWDKGGGVACKAQTTPPQGYLHFTSNCKIISPPARSLVGGLARQPGKERWMGGESKTHRRRK